MRRAKTTGAVQAIRAAAHNARAMQITLKLFATLTESLPAPARVGNQIDLDVAATAAILEEGELVFREIIR